VLTLIAAAEPSRTAFYIMGSVLAIYAVVLGVIGITQPAFPYGARGARLVMGLSTLMMAATIASAILTDP
jgi:hypothetical protein